ncbi:hypothetical protein [Mammaliicoccus lentus]|uniref:hypothetical protein n=1 Tax=Mammaliicoccus lentus TaxID=42858 RepID=UPI0010722029|nr:hypothetical protein [Mammaliicoccus lentus]MBF0749306.1 hypothetical protein [Mammaliicoccus lentus]TFU57977.1 hypothetical protein E4T93_07805 [Mammaliicoccus lentus]
MFKQVYLYDGTPYLAFKDEEGEYQYPEEAWTETPPPDGIYSPFYFNGNEWIGASKEEWELNNITDPTPNDLKLMVSNLQKQLVMSNLNMSKMSQVNMIQTNDIKELKEQLANVVLELTKLKNGSVE